MRALFYVLIVDRFQQATFDRGNDAGQFMPAFQYLAVLTEERPHALLIAQCRPFFDPRLRPFRGTAETQLFRYSNELAHLSEIDHRLILL